jgi:hypothetical protein
MFTQLFFFSFGIKCVFSAQKIATFVKSKIEKKNIESQTWVSERWAFFKKFVHSNHARIFQFIRLKGKKVWPLG